MNILRTDWNTYFMLNAHLVATRSTCDRGPELLFDKGRHGVGCVLVKDKRIIATGYNGSPPNQPHCLDPDEFYACRTCMNHFKTSDSNFDGIPGDSGWDTVHNVSGRGMVGMCSKCKNEVRVNKCHGGHLMVDNHCVRTIHAEMNAIVQCALDGVSPKGATIYTTASLCYDCAKVAIRAGIDKVVVSEIYSSRYGLSKKAEDMLSSANIIVISCDVRDTVKFSVQ